MECSICLNQLTEPPASITSKDLDIAAKCKEREIKKLSKLCCTPCGHVYHRPCLLSWLQSRSRTCPFCRKRVTQEKLYPVFLAPDEQGKHRKHGKSSKESHSQPKTQASCFTRMTASFFSSFRRGSRYSVSPSSSSHDQSMPQQVQVAVTINCVPQSRNEAVVEGESHLPGRSFPETSQSLRACHCPHHRPH